MDKTYIERSALHKDQEHPPTTLRRRSRQPIVRTRVTENRDLVSWDCIQDCEPEYCPIGTTCVCASTALSPDGNGKCDLQYQYLQEFVNMIFRTYRYVDEGSMFKVGMHLIPLYAQLCKMKIAEKAVRTVSYEDLRGNTKINPIYREIRDVMRTITQMWKELDMDVKAAEPSVVEFAGGRTGFGDPNHYAALVRDADNKRDVIR
jgi:hypothetical protein